MAEVGDDLPAGEHQQVRVGPLDRAELVPEPGHDVVHDREHVEAHGSRPGHELVPLGRSGVRVAAVLVQVGVVPPGFGPGDVGCVDGIRRGRRAAGGHRPGGHGHPEGGALGADLPGAELDPPHAGFHRPGPVAAIGRSGLDPDGRLTLVGPGGPAARPTPEPVGGPVPGGIPEPEVEHRVVLGRPPVPHLQPGGALRDEHGQHPVGLVLLGGEATGDHRRRPVEGHRGGHGLGHRRSLRSPGAAGGPVPLRR